MRLNSVKRACHNLPMLRHSNRQIQLIVYVICFAVNHESALPHVFSCFCFFADLLGIGIKNRCCLQSKLPCPAESDSCISSLLHCLLSNLPVFAFDDKKRRACHVGMKHNVVCLCVFFNHN